ncbi:phosphoglycerate dehydrogenase [Candidatus Paraluminiphilus aquimaris]|uniref:2-oxoglutarate reductase n=1 Tax=Candidatus Paraluminiphilus aquimaris TaxID=2518994 RepID=A0ABY6Q5R4_9GAMM|nr:phosphoglycerate dehydrogenase [Candidatus Paraluminiphilus aquimaris]UZP73638.1 phosphoglycerate dehydrogenase [Candidatus Paraluminiphilus aquimaris]
MKQQSLQKSKIKFLLLEGVHQSAIDALAKAGYTNVVTYPKALPSDDLKKEIKDAHFVGIRSRTQLSAEIFEAADRLVAIGCFCIGTNQVDLEAAAKRGIPVFNAPFSNTRSVAELVMAEIILLLRGVPQRSAAAHRGEWQKSATGAFECRGKTLGIIGYGNIGMQLGVIAESLGMKVVYFDVESKLPLGNAQPKATLSALLKEAHVVSLHVPQHASTELLIGQREIAAMRSGSILINASRGNVVDLDALAEALNGNHIGGAAIDVFPVEPRSNNDEFISPLRGLDQCILTPHIGGSTQEAQENIGVEVAEKLTRYSDNGTTTSAVNFPEVALPEHEGKHRLLHVHQNIPGIMSAINQVFSESAVNVSGQYLQTMGDTGYVVIDIESDYSKTLISQLSGIEGTLRTRVLF